MKRQFKKKFPNLFRPKKSQGFTWSETLKNIVAFITAF